VQQHELRPARGAKRPRKRIGRGNASGKGTYAGKGLKGQQARSGPGPRPGFEGGQTPLIRRLPARRGFRNPFRIDYTPVNVKDLARFEAGAEVTPETLAGAGLLGSAREHVKVLGDGELSTALTVRAHRVSAGARVKIEAAGGTVEELAPRVKKTRERGRGKAPAPAPAAEENAADQSTKGDSSEAEESE
jgi:large subunit ribosomal protein L15